MRGVFPVTRHPIEAADDLGIHPDYKPWNYGDYAERKGHGFSSSAGSGDGQHCMIFV